MERNETENAMASIEEVGKTILTLTKERLGGLWEQLSVEDRMLISECALDAANLQMAALATAGNSDAAIALAREKKQIDAQFANIVSGDAEAVRGTFWAIVREVVQIAMDVLFKRI